MTRLHFEAIPIIENNDPMVDIAAYPFVGESVYYQQGYADNPKLYTRKAIAEKLMKLQDTTLKGYQFKIWDPWRPRAVQAKIYKKFYAELGDKNPDWSEEKLKDEVALFVTAPDQPRRIPPHSTGGAIDLTLIDRKTGRELDMGTGFDHFGPEAYKDYFEVAERDMIVRDNRRLLHKAMLSEDFIIDNQEWWHFDYGSQKWALLAKKPQAFYGEILSIK